MSQGQVELIQERVSLLKTQMELDRFGIFKIEKQTETVIETQTDRPRDMLREGGRKGMALHK